MTYPYKKREPQKGLPKLNNVPLLKPYMNNIKKFMVWVELQQSYYLSTELKHSKSTTKT